MQLPLMRGSSESTAAVTKLAKPMLVMKRPRLSTCSIGSSPVFPIGDLDFAAQHAGLDAHVRDGFGQAKGAAPWFAVFAGLRRSAKAHVVVALFGGAALMDGRKRQESRQAAGGGAGVHPRQFERHQRQRQVLGTFDEAALRRFHDQRR